MILIAGGTGTLGTRVVERLVASGEKVRVLTRDRKRAGHFPAVVEVVTGDVRVAADVAAAVRGCTTVISAVHGFAGADKPTPEAVDREGNRLLIGAAKDAAVKHFVLLSVQAASADHPMSLHRAKHAAEQELLASGLPFTIIRPTAFFETWISIIGGTLAQNGKALVFGPGRNPINFVSVRDVAALVETVARSASPSGDVVEIGGPQNLGFVAVAEQVIAASGKPGRVQHIPLPMLRAMSVLARPVAPMFARQAKAAVVMNTIDMTFDLSRSQPPYLPTLPVTRLDDLLRPRTGN